MLEEIHKFRSQTSVDNRDHSKDFNTSTSTIASGYKYLITWSNK